MEVVDMEEEIPMKVMQRTPARLPPLRANKVAPVEITMLPPLSGGRTDAAEGAGVKDKVEDSNTDVGDEVDHPEKQPRAWYRSKVVLAIPFVACAIALTLLCLALSVADWNKFSATPIETTSSASTKQATPSTITPSTAPASTDVTTSSTSTSSSTTGSVDTTVTATSTQDTTTVESTITTTAAQTTTTVEEVTTTSTAEPTTSTAVTTTEPTTTTTEPTTSTTESLTTTTNEPDKLVAYGFVLSIADKFTAKLFDPDGAVYHQLAKSTCGKVSAVFNGSDSYTGCVVTSIRPGSIRITLSTLFAYPPDTNLTEAKEIVAHNASTGLSALISNLPQANITQSDECIDCSSNVNLAAVIKAQAKDYCNITNPCAANGTCVSGLNTYFCACDLGYYGKQCEIKTSDCDRIHCHDHGDCLASLSGKLGCQCNSMYQGDRCETLIVVENITYPCANFTSPCSGHGECIDLSASLYRCICDVGYNGTDCEEDIDDCARGPCFHGNCTDRVNGFSCDCEPGYDGVQCQININECLSSPCGLNGTCYDLVNGYICDCNRGYKGNDCHSICDDKPCFNNGTCTLCPQGYCTDTKLSFQCDCPTGIYGLLCTNEKYPGF